MSRPEPIGAGEHVGFTLDTHHCPESGHAVVEAGGEVDQLTRARLAATLAAAVAAVAERPGRAAVVLDLSRVSFFSAAGVHCVVDAAAALAARDRALHLVCPPGGPAWTVLDLLALLPAWPVHATLDVAARALVA